MALKSAGKFSVGFETASSLPTCSGVSRRSSAFRFASRCSIVRAPRIVLVTPGLCWTQESATVGTSLPTSAAICWATSMMSSCLGVSCPIKLPRKPSIFLPFVRVYLPDSAPILSGLQGKTPRPSSSAIGVSSPSTVRSISEYSTCRPIRGTQPRNCAMSCACATFQAGASEKPR